MPKEKFRIKITREEHLHLLEVAGRSRSLTIKLKLIWKAAFYCYWFRPPKREVLSRPGAAFPNRLILAVSWTGGNVGNLLDNLAKWLGYVPEQKLKDCQFRVNSKNDEVKRLHSDLNDEVKKLANSLSGMIHVYERSPGDKPEKYGIYTEIEFDRMRRIFDDFQITNGSAEYEYMLNGIYYEIGRNFSALLRLTR